MTDTGKIKTHTELARMMSQQISDLPIIQKNGNLVRACVYFRMVYRSVFSSHKEMEIRNYYLRLFKKYDSWQLSDLYEDEGKSTLHLEMMHKKAKQGAYDIIISPSFSYFAKNPSDTMAIVKELKALSKPVGIYFEVEDLYTLNADALQSMNLLLLLREYESVHKSQIMRWSAGIKSE